jgi:hypothetical protein
MTNLASDVAVLPSMVARLNIELFCKKLAEETNEAKRQTLLQLVDEEKAKLFALSPPPVPWFVKKSPHFQQNARDRRPQCGKV